MLPKKYRLPLRTELNRLKKTGQIYQGNFFGFLMTSQTPSLDNSRFAFIVSNKIDKKAHHRNHLRRWLSAVIWLLASEIKPGFDGVFLAKKTAAQADYSQIENDVKKIFRKAKLIADSVK